MMNVARGLRSLFIALVVLFTSQISHAQNETGIEIGGWLGASYYFGDLNTGFSLSNPDYAGGLIFRYNMNSRINIKSSLNYGRFSYADADSDILFERTRNLSFHSNVWDLTGQLEFNFLPFEHGHREHWYTPYMFIGLSAFHFNPKAELNGVTYNLSDFGTEGQTPGDEYSLTQLALAYGVGYKFDITPKWSINIEISNRLLGTDYFDDVSGVYPDLDELESLRGPTSRQLSDRSIEEDNVFSLGEEGVQRGNSRRNDSYHFAQIGLLYYIGWRKCPAISTF